MGEPGRRVCKDVVQGGVAVHLDEVIVIDVRNPGLKNVDGLGEDHRRREEEVPGEEPLFRQRVARDAGVTKATAACSEARHLKHTRRPSPSDRKHNEVSGPSS